MKKLWAAVTAMAIMVILPGAALAASDQTVTLAKGDNRTGTYFAKGSSVVVNGDVAGDVVCAGQDVVVNGAVGGDVLCVGQSVTVNGPVAGSVRVAGQMVTVNGTVGRNVTVAGQNITLGGGAHVSGEVAAAGQRLTMNGPVDHDVWARMDTFELGSTIGGNLSYMSDTAFGIDRSKVKGSVMRRAVPHSAQQTSTSSRLGSLLYWVVSGLVIALAAVWLAPGLVRSATDAMIKRPGATLGWGALTIAAGPVLLVALALTVIGLPLTLLLAVVWLTGLLTASLVAGVAVGRLAMGRREADLRQLALAALAGVPLVLIVNWLPWLGFVTGLATGAWAMGGLVLSVAKARTAAR